MSFIAVFVLVAVFLVVPIMIGARIVNAKNTGFGSALLAVVIYAVASAAIDGVVDNEILAFLLTAGVGAFVLSFVLGTTFLRGLAVSIFATVVQVVVVLLFAGVLLGTGTVA